MNKIAAYLSNLTTPITSQYYRSRSRFTNKNPAYTKYSIGNYTYGTPMVLFNHPLATLKIGKFCAISSNVTIFLGGEHHTEWISTYPFTPVFKMLPRREDHPITKGDVIIGNDVWIGINATILSGVKIGDGAVVGAYSVVAKDVPPYSIVAGNPARIVRMRFDEETIRKLLELKWWNWNIQMILKFTPLLLSSNMSEFFQETNKL